VFRYSSCDLVIRKITLVITAKIWLLLDFALQTKGMLHKLQCLWPVDSTELLAVWTVQGFLVVSGVIQNGPYLTFRPYLQKCRLYDFGQEFVEQFVEVYKLLPCL